MSFCWVPTRLMMRNGQYTEVKRTAEHWKTALRGHIKSAHNGKVDENCAGCQELLRRQKESRP